MYFLNSTYDNVFVLATVIIKFVKPLHQNNFSILLHFLYFSCMVTIEVDVVYNQIMRGTIM